jgi:nucleoside-diphosphate-sugar epimerase
VNAAPSDNGLALVTGFPGWLGNRLVHFLHQPHPDWPDGVEQPRFERIRCLVLSGADQRPVRSRYPDLELVEGDIRDPAAVGRLCAGAEGATVFHLAGIIHPRRVRELYDINTHGTRHLLAAAAAAGVKRVVATSSNSPAGVARDSSVLFDENSPYRPYMNYGRSKKLMEDDLNEAHRSGAVETVVLRPCWFYGPEQPPRQSEFFHMIKAGMAPIVGGGEARRSMSYVDSTALGLLLAGVNERAAGQTYWIADSRPYSMNEIVDTVENLLESEFGMQVAHRRVRLPALASEVALVIDAAIQTAGLYEQRIHVLSEMNKTIACSVAKARDELGYHPRVELREGMRRSIEWCLANGQKI